MGVLYKFFSFIGFLLLLAMIAGATYDFVTHEKNLDLAKLDKTTNGFVKRGYVLDFHYDCKSGGFKGIQVFRAMLSYKEMDATKKSEIHFTKACEGLIGSTSTPTPETNTEAKTDSSTTTESKPEEEKKEETKTEETKTDS